MIASRRIHDAIQRVSGASIEIRERTRAQRECAPVRARGRVEADGAAANSGQSEIVKLTAVERQGSTVDVRSAVVIHDDCGQSERTRTARFGESSVVVKHWRNARSRPCVGEVSV